MHPLYTRLLVLFVLFYSSISYAQEVASVDSLAQDSARVARRIPTYDLVYERMPKHGTSFAIQEIGSCAFNQGLITDPALLTQGKLAGVQTYAPGGDPNGVAMMQIRGLSGFSPNRPVVVVDGFIGASMANIDPSDVASITVIRDAEAQALFGVQGYGGAVLIKTKTGYDTRRPLTVKYSGRLAQSVAHDGIAVMDADAFRTAGGQDLGAATVWRDEILRDAISQRHHLAVLGNKGMTHYRFSGSYQNVNGVLRGSGFEQFNGRANVGTSLLDKRLSVNLTTGFTKRNSQLGFPDAFRYAVTFNPTAPVFARDATTPIDPIQYGGYFETVGLFDSFNPRAMVGLNSSLGLTQLFQAAAQVKYNFTRNFRVIARYGYENSFSNERTFHSQQALYRGNANSPIRRGRADLRDNSSTLYRYDIFANYFHTTTRSSFHVTLGTTATGGDFTSLYISGRGFANVDIPDILERKKIENLTDGLDAFDSVDIRSEGSKRAVEQAYFGRLYWGFRHILHLNASLRYEKNGLLGPTSELWGLLPHVGAAIFLGKNMRPFDSFKVRANYGGVIQNRFAPLSRIISIVSNGVPVEIINAGGPGIKWERKAELNVGMDVEKGGFTASVDVFQRNISDFITATPLADLSVAFMNSAEIQTQGAELTLTYTTPKDHRLRWNTQAVLSTYKSTMESFPIGPRMYGFIGATPISNTAVVRVASGQELGQIWGPVYTGVGPNGEAVYADIKKDGRLVTAPTDALAPNADYAVLGNGIPDFELGWSHQLSLGNWALGVSVRGAFGHSLVNINRLLYENGPFFPTYNSVHTDLDVAGLRDDQFSSLYVERADFLKLDYLTFIRTFLIGEGKEATQLRVGLALQNVVLTTRYTGGDPEPRLQNLDSPEGTSDRIFAPGIDRLGRYTPARTASLQVGFVF